MIFSEHEYRKMAEVENTHWWYKSLHDLVLKTIEENFKDKNVKILDAGCGTGGMIDYLISNGFSNIEGFDLSEVAVSFCKNKGYRVVVGDIKETESVMSSNKYDVIISNDTLYFFSDLDVQKRIISGFYNVLKKNGIIIMNLPAFRLLGGIHDIAVCGRCRFTKGDIRKIINKEQFVLQKALYWPFLLSPVIFIARTLQRIKRRMVKNIKIESDIDLPPGWLNMFLYNLIKFENAVVKWKPFASSLFLVIKKK